MPKKRKPPPPDPLALKPIASADAEPLFNAATTACSVSKFPHGKESRVYAICPTNLSDGSAAWIVIREFGYPPEPLQYEQSAVLETKERAGSLVWDLLAKDWAALRDRMDEDETTPIADLKALEEIDGRSIADIAGDDTDDVYSSAFDNGDIRTFDSEVEDAHAHAVCPIENEIGCKGWAVISAKGHSWEGITCWLDDVFATEEAAYERQRSLLDSDQEEWEEENREQEDEAEDQDEDDDSDNEGEEEESEAEGAS